MVRNRKFVLMEIHRNSRFSGATSQERYPSPAAIPTAASTAKFRARAILAARAPKKPARHDLKGE